jgi:hypothetical protein
MSAFCKVVALVCIALVVATAIAGGAASHFSDVLLPLSLLLFPVLLFVGLVRYHDESRELLGARRSPPTPRAPPVLLHA